MTHPHVYPNDKASRPQAANRRVPMWPGIASVFIIMALLLSFHQVVQGAVKQGAERNIASALLASATRECKALPSLDAIDRCNGLLKTSGAPTATQTAFFSSF